MAIKEILMKDYPVNYMTMIIYGKPGVKKSRFAASAPKPCLIDIDNGLSSVRDIISPETPIFQIDRWEDILAMLAKLRENKPGWQTVVLDSFTLFERMIIAHALQTTGHDKPEINDWQIVKDKSVKLMEWIKALPMHRIFVCLEKTYENKITKEISIGPSLPGTLLEEAPAYVDECYHMRVVSHIDQTSKKKEFRSELLTRNEGYYIAKNRGGGLERIEEPNFNNILAKILKSKVPTAKVVGVTQPQQTQQNEEKK